MLIKKAKTSVYGLFFRLKRHVSILPLTMCGMSIEESAIFIFENAMVKITFYWSSLDFYYPEIRAFWKLN